MIRTLAINKEGKKIRISRFQASNAIYCYDKGLVELYVAKGINTVVCYHNNLTVLELPKSVATLNCCGNKLTTLILPDSIRWLSCDKELIDYDKTKIKEVHIIYTP